MTKTGTQITGTVDQADGVKWVETSWVREDVFRVDAIAVQDDYAEVNVTASVQTVDDLRALIASLQAALPELVAGIELVGR